MIEPERHGRVLTDTMPTSTGCGTERRSPSSKTAYLLAEMIGALLHVYGLEPAGPAGRLAQGRRPAPERAIDGAALSFDQRPTITREERFAADVRLRRSHRAWRDKRRTPLPRPVPGPRRRSG